MVRIKEILQWIDSWAPFKYAESWDNSGLQVGSPKSPVEKVLVALDPTSLVIAEAREIKCQCVVTHHPLLMQSINSVRSDKWPGAVISEALVSGIGIIAAHTNLDAARGGTNAQFVKLLKLEAVEPLDPVAEFSGEGQYLGLGVVGLLPGEETVKSLSARVSELLGRPAVRVCGDMQRRVKKVGVCTGSGASLIGKVLRAEAEAFITGDLKYHDARLAEERGLVIIDVGHFASERIVLEPIADFLRTRAESEGARLEVFISKSEKDPFNIIA